MRASSHSPVHGVEGWHGGVGGLGWHGGVGGIGWHGGVGGIEWHGGVWSEWVSDVLRLAIDTTLHDTTRHCTVFHQ